MADQQQYPLTTTQIRISINGEDRSDELVARTLFARNILGSQVDTCGFQLKPKEEWRGVRGDVPPIGGTFLFEVKRGGGDWEKQFGGVITRVNRQLFAYKVYGWSVEAVDYTHYATRQIVDRTFVDMNVSDIAREVVQHFVPFVSTSGIQDSETKIDHITFSREYPGDVLDSLARIVGYEWSITPDKVVKFFDPAKANQSPLAIEDTSDNYNNLTIQPNLDQVRNRVIVTGGEGLSDLIVEDFEVDGERSVFGLEHSDIIADLRPLSSGTLSPSNFMKVNGQPQIVGVAGTLEDFEGLDFLLTPEKGVVETSEYRDLIPKGSRVTFSYKKRVPINAMREDLLSQRTIAQLEGVDYQSVIEADNPSHWYRFDGDEGSLAANEVDVSYSGMYNGTLEDRDICGPLSGAQGKAWRLRDDTWMETVSGVRTGANGFTAEVWVKADPKTNQGIIGQWDTDGGGRGNALLISGGQYIFRHATLNFQSLTAPRGTGFDHVVITWNGGKVDASGDFRFYINKEVKEIGVTGGSDAVPPRGVEIGSIDYGDGPLYAKNAEIAEFALYDGVLDTGRIAVHHDAGRMGGVREAVVEENATSWDQAQRIADQQLLRYSNPLTNITFDSYVAGWQAGDLVPISVSGIGTTFSGQALIQEVNTRALGSQKLDYQVSCVSSRYNIVDYFRSLRQFRNLVTGRFTVVDVVKALDDEAAGIVVHGGPASLGENTDGFYIAPDFGDPPEEPVLRVELGIIDEF